MLAKKYILGGNNICTASLLTNMNIKQVSKALTSPRFLAPTVFLAVSTGKTLQDYEKAKPYKKNTVLVKDSAMLTGSMLGFIITNPIARAFCNKNHFNKVVLKQTEYIARQTVGALTVTLGGILGAIWANSFAHKFILNRPYFKKQEELDRQAEKNKILVESSVFKNFNYVNDQFKQTAFTVLSLPNMSLFTAAPMLALTGMSVAKTEGYNNKIKRTAKELIANSLVPTVLISGVSLAVEHKKWYIKYPALFGALTVGSYAGKKVSEKYHDKWDDAIDSIDFQNINIKQAFNFKGIKDFTEEKIKPDNSKV